MVTFGRFLLHFFAFHFANLVVIIRSQAIFCKNYQKNLSIGSLIVIQVKKLDPEYQKTYIYYLNDAKILGGSLLCINIDQVYYSLIYLD